MFCRQPCDHFCFINIAELAKLMRFKKKHSIIGFRVMEIENREKVIKPWIFEENQWILSYLGAIWHILCPEDSAGIR